MIQPIDPTGEHTDECRAAPARCEPDEAPPPAESAAAVILVPEAGSPSGGDAIHVAKRAQRRRELRLRRFDAELGQDATWNMLLELLVARLEGRRVAVKCLWLASGAAESSAFRWIGRLEQLGHLTRLTDPKDGRRQFIEMSDELARRLLLFLRDSEA